MGENLSDHGDSNSLQIVGVHQKFTWSFAQGQGHGLSPFMPAGHVVIPILGHVSAPALTSLFLVSGLQLLSCSITVSRPMLVCVSRAAKMFE